MGVSFGATGAISYTRNYRRSSSRLLVGSNIAPLSSTAVPGAQKRDCITAEADDVRFSSGLVFDAAKQIAQNGGQAQNFRNVDLGALYDPRREAQGLSGPDLSAATKTNYIYSDSQKKVSYAEGMLQVWQKDDKGKMQLADEFQVTGDGRLSWDQDGNAVYQTGVAAKVGGKLAAVGMNEILVRTSGIDVVGGNNTTVFNLSDQKGHFSGGSSVKYLGAYADCSFENASGSTEYAGYFFGASIVGGETGKGVYSGVFENSSLANGKQAGRFSGYFSGSAISSGELSSVFDGMFMNKSQVQAGDGGNTFSGRFMDSALKSGAGDDSFGVGVNLDKPGYVKTVLGESYRGIQADFIQTDIDAGAGNDSFNAMLLRGSLDLGAGDDSAKGIFERTTVTAGPGNDSLAAVLAKNSVFQLGDGNNELDFGTALDNEISTGSGKNSINLGHNQDQAVAGKADKLGGDRALSSTIWKTVLEHKKNMKGRDFGELSGNVLDAKQGENFITVQTGQGTQAVWTGDQQSAEAKALETLDGLALARRQERPEAADRRLANERYARMVGDGLVTNGETGVKIITGAEEDLSIQAGRQVKLDKPQGWNRRSIMKHDGRGNYEYLNFSV